MSNQPTFLIVNFGGPWFKAEIPSFLRSLLTDQDCCMYPIACLYPPVAFYMDCPLPCLKNYSGLRSYRREVAYL